MVWAGFVGVGLEFAVVAGEEELFLWEGFGELEVGFASWGEEDGLDCGEGEGAGKWFRDCGRGVVFCVIDAGVSIADGFKF